MNEAVQRLAERLALWLQAPWSGHPVWGWLTVPLTVLLVVALTRLLRPWLAQRLQRLAARTSAPLGEGLRLACLATQPWLVGAMALHPATTGLPLQGPWPRLVEAVSLAGLFMQTGLWAARLIDHGIRRSQARALATDPGTATGLAVTSFIARLALWSVMLLLLLDNLGINITSLVAGLGVGGVAVGFALQSILGDLFSSLSIVLDKPFQIGHFIDVEGHIGTVEYIGLKTTRVRALSGEMLVFSNADLTRARLRNYQAMQERRVAFGFTLRHDTPTDALEAVPAILQAIIEVQPNVRFDRAHFKTLGHVGLDFEVVYHMLVADYSAYMDTQQAINLALLRALGARDIGLARPVALDTRSLRGA